MGSYRNVGYFDIYYKEKKDPDTYRHQECCSIVRDVFSNYEKTKVHVYIPVSCVKGKKNVTKLIDWIKFINYCHLPCKYIGIRKLTKSYEYKGRVKTGHVIEIDYSKYKISPHVLATFSAIRYFYVIQYKGIVEKALELKKKFPRWTCFLCLNLAHYNDNYNNYYGLRFRNISYPITLREFKKRTSSSLNLHSGSINNIFDNSIEKYRSCAQSLPISRLGEIVVNKEREAYRKCIELFQNKKYLELSNFIKKHEVDKKRENRG